MVHGAWCGAVSVAWHVVWSAWRGCCVCRHESASFQALFPELKYLVGGAASGFAHVEESAYAPRLLQVKKTGKLTRYGTI
jgi:hypothetical protein